MSIDSLHSLKSSFLNLNQKNYITIEYIWLGGLGNIKSKLYSFKSEVFDENQNKYVFKPIDDIKQVPKWSYDGSRTFQTSKSLADIQLIPVMLYNDPFRGNPNKLVLCEAYYADGTPTDSNFRHFATKCFTEQNIKKHEPWFGIEQEYLLLEFTGTELKWPYGWTKGQFVDKDGNYYCANGKHLAFGRPIIEAHLKACLFAGIKIYGINSEDIPSQWEFQIGTATGIRTADDLIMARFILIRVAEAYGVSIGFDAKFFKDWSGNGGHTNFSTKQTREKGGMDLIINEHMPKLEKYHKEFIYLYGEGNDLRLKGIFDAPDINKFEYGVMDRKASVRIPSTTKENKGGYYEDRRPAANVDPYIAMSLIYSVTCLEDNIIPEITNQYKKLLDNIKRFKLGII